MSTLGTTLSQGKSGWGWSQSRGPYRTVEWTGTRAQINAKAAELKAAGYEIQVDEGFGLDRLTGTIATNENVPGTSEITENWIIQGNKVLKDVLAVDCATVLALTDNDINELRHYQNNPPGPGKSPTFTNSANQLPIWKLMKAGFSHVPVWQPVLRHSLTVPANRFVTISYAYVGRIFSTASLASIEGLPANFGLPLSQLATRYTNPSRTDTVALSYGWLKNMPSQEVALGGKTQVAIDYEFGLWPTLIYGSVL